ncbi:Flp family type IVb pilin [Cupriavidus cauae]|uniref:Flp family type IVb pilin n=1 Tax=Cupriavidus cauae TaxID=2608999 RepID=A0A5M8AL74_9BURK|nr:Flp family type IVb pilin [Cupriavidus cauae]KAA6124193.1 Flp family type IVb pilin [Cupriavidus cauae]
MKQGFLRFIRDERGATAIEYGLIAGLIALAVAGAAESLGTNLSGAFTKLAGKLEAFVK